MTFTIVWSEFAEIQIDEIYNYHQKAAGTRVALKLVRGILKAPDKLLIEPRIGQLEELLEGRVIEYRYLVHKNYKLIYSINEVSQQIRIADVFDTRQEPIKIKRKK